MHHQHGRCLSVGWLELEPEWVIALSVGLGHRDRMYTGLLFVFVFLLLSIEEITFRLAFHPPV